LRTKNGKEMSGIERYVEAMMGIINSNQWGGKLKTERVKED